MSVQKGLACEAMDGACSSRHDGADAAFAASRTSFTKVGDLDGFFIDYRGP